ncbi:hypothetical protein ScalyP_jg10361 [Parmales sp. scaly parma]|nr:hypothetical protein ScalyP_jg10361 [Parmales sp. scaly parma]
MKAAIMWLGLILAVTVALGADDNVRQIQYDFLTKFYASAGGDGWYYKEGWDKDLSLTENQCSGLFGITCDDEGRIIYIYYESYEEGRRGTGLGGTIPVEIRELASLEAISLQFTELSGMLPVATWANLTYFDIRSSKFTSIDDNLRLCKKLEFLYLGSNPFEEALPSWIGDFEQLKDLRIGRLGIEAIPSWLTNAKFLPNLIYLYLVSNELTTLSDLPFGRMTSLEFLNLGWNSLTELPTSMNALNNLKELHIWGNYGLSFRNINFGNFPLLEKLELGKIHLEELPPTFNSLHKLKQLNLQENKISSISNIDFTQMSELEELHLHVNNIKDLPRSISTLHNLTTLSIGKNPLANGAPEWLGDLNLRALNIDNLNISAIPQLKQTLTHLDVRNNIIAGDATAITIDILTRFPDLKTLYLNDNRLRGDLSEDFGKRVRQLNELYIDYNDITFSSETTKSNTCSNVTGECKLDPQYNEICEQPFDENLIAHGGGCETCSGPDRCKIDPPFLLYCHGVWEGPTCGRCPSTHINSNGICVFCDGATTFVYDLLVLGGLLISAFGFYHLCKRQIKQVAGRVATSSMEIQINIKQLANAYQIMSLVMKFEVPYPVWFKTFADRLARLSALIPVPPVPCMDAMKEQPQYIQAMVLLLFFWTITAGLILTSFRCDKHKKQQLQHLAAFLLNLSVIAVFSVAINLDPLFEAMIANRSNWRLNTEMVISMCATVAVALVLAVVTYFTNTLAYYNYSRALIAREKGSDLEEFKIFNFSSYICAPFVSHCASFEGIMLRRRVLIWLVDPLVSVASFSFRYQANDRSTNDRSKFAKLVSEYSLEWLIPKPKDLGGLPIFVVFAQNILLTMVNTHYVRQLAARPFISTGEVVDPLNDAEILHSRYFIYAGLLGMLITLISNSSLSDAAILILKNCCCVAIIGLMIFMSRPNLRHMYKCLNKKMKEIIRLSEKNRRDFGTRESRAESTLEEVGVDLIEAMLESDDDYEILDLKIEFAGKAKSREDKHRFNQMSMKT